MVKKYLEAAPAERAVHHESNQPKPSAVQKSAASLKGLSFHDKPLIAIVAQASPAVAREFEQHREALLRLPLRGQFTIPGPNGRPWVRGTDGHLYFSLTANPNHWGRIDATGNFRREQDGRFTPIVNN